MTFEIIYQDDKIIAINKPVDLSFHGEELHKSLKEQIGLDIFSVHRLDKATSGVLIFALTSEFASLLGELFKAKKIRKIYHAVSNHRPSKKQGLIKGDMTKGRNGNWSLSRQMTNPAITKFESLLLTSGKRFFILKPLTGKTHQLRVAMKSLGSPILGDVRYSHDTADRMYLHCFEMEFALFDKNYKITAINKTGSFWL